MRHTSPLHGPSHVGSPHEIESGRPGGIQHRDGFESGPASMHSTPAQREKTINDRLRVVRPEGDALTVDRLPPKSASTILKVLSAHEAAGRLIEPTLGTRIWNGIKSTFAGIWNWRDPNASRGEQVFRFLTQIVAPLALFTLAVFTIGPFAFFTIPSILGMMAGSHVAGRVGARAIWGGEAQRRTASEAAARELLGGSPTHRVIYDHVEANNLLPRGEFDLATRSYLAEKLRLLEDRGEPRTAANLQKLILADLALHLKDLHAAKSTGQDKHGAAAAAAGGTSGTGATTTTTSTTTAATTTSASTTTAPASAGAEKAKKQAEQREQANRGIDLGAMARQAEKLDTSAPLRFRRRPRVGAPAPAGETPGTELPPKIRTSSAPSEATTLAALPPEALASLAQARQDVKTRTATAFRMASDVLAWLRQHGRDVSGITVSLATRQEQSKTLRKLAQGLSNEIGGDQVGDNETYKALLRAFGDLADAHNNLGQREAGLLKGGAAPLALTYEGDSSIPRNVAPAVLDHQDVETDQLHKGTVAVRSDDRVTSTGESSRDRQKALKAKQAFDALVQKIIAEQGAAVAVNGMRDDQVYKLMVRMLRQAEGTTALSTGASKSYNALVQVYTNLASAKNAVAASDKRLKGDAAPLALTYEGDLSVPPAMPTPARPRPEVARTMDRAGINVKEPGSPLERAAQQADYTAQVLQARLPVETPSHVDRSQGGTSPDHNAKLIKDGIDTANAAAAKADASGDHARLNQIMSDQLDLLGNVLSDEAAAQAKAAAASAMADIDRNVEKRLLDEAAVKAAESAIAAAHAATAGSDTTTTKVTAAKTAAAAKKESAASFSKATASSKASDAALKSHLSLIARMKQLINEMTKIQKAIKAKQQQISKEGKLVRQETLRELKYSQEQLQRVEGNFNLLYGQLNSRIGSRPLLQPLLQNLSVLAHQATESSHRSFLRRAR